MKLKQLYRKWITMKKRKKLERTNIAQTISANENNVPALSQEAADAFMSYWLECREKGYHLTSDDFKGIQALLSNPDPKCTALQTIPDDMFKKFDRE